MLDDQMNVFCGRCSGVMLDTEKHVFPENTDSYVLSHACVRSSYIYFFCYQGCANVVLYALKYCFEP